MNSYETRHGLTNWFYRDDMDGQLQDQLVLLGRHGLVVGPS